jgi:threonine synthase
VTSLSHTLVCGYCDAAEADCTCKQTYRRTFNRRVEYAALKMPAAQLRDSFQGRDLWRYQALLPVDHKFGTALAVGGTPLLNLGVQDRGVRLYIKDEMRNPSGSLKDRATEVALAVARSQGHDEVIVASTGNAGASLACIAAASGLEAKVVVPASAPQNKLRQILAYGAELVTVDGSYDEAYDYALEYARSHDVYCRNTGFNPYVREGKKTCAFEIAEQLGWNVPDWVFVPCGDGSIFSGIETGFAQLASAGLIKQAPRLVAVQADTSHSISLTYAEYRSTGQLPTEPVPVVPDTAADSIAVSRPRDFLGAVRALARNGGCTALVSEDEIREASSVLSGRLGLWAEPASASGYAALRRLLADGTVQAGQSAVVVLTGSGLKDPDPWSN